MFNMQAFLATLPIAALGMAGIFIVMLLIAGTIILLKKIV